MGQEASTSKYKLRPSDTQKMQNIIMTEPDDFYPERRSTYKNSSMHEGSSFLKLSNTKELNKAVEFLSSYLLLGPSSKEDVANINTNPLLAIEANVVNDGALGCQKELRKVITTAQISSILSDELFKQQANNAYKRFSFADQKAQLNLQISRPSGRLSNNIVEPENDLRASRMIKKMGESAFRTGSPDKSSKLRQELEKLENTIRKSRSFSSFVPRNNQPAGDKTLEEQENLSVSFATKDRSMTNSFIDESGPHQYVHQQQQQEQQRQQQRQQNLQKDNAFMPREEKFAWEADYNTPPKKMTYREIETQTEQYETPYYSNADTNSVLHTNQSEYDSRRYNNERVTTSKFLDQPDQETKPTHKQGQEEPSLSAREKRDDLVKPGHKKTYTITAKKSPSPTPKPKNPYANIKSRYLETHSKEGAYAKDPANTSRERAVPNPAKQTPTHTREKSTSRSQNVVDKDQIPVVYADLQGGRSRSKTPSKVNNDSRFEAAQNSNFYNSTPIKQNMNYVPHAQQYQNVAPQYQSIPSQSQYQSNYNHQQFDSSREHQPRNNGYRGRQQNNERSYRENEFSPINTELNLEEIMVQAGSRAYNNQSKNNYNQNYQNYTPQYDQRQQSPKQGYSKGNYRNEYNQPNQNYYQNPNQSQSQSQPRQNKWKAVSTNQNYTPNQKYANEADSYDNEEEEIGQGQKYGGHNQGYKYSAYAANPQNDMREQERRELRHYNAYNNSSYRNYQS